MTEAGYWESCGGMLEKEEVRGHLGHSSTELLAVSNLLTLIIASNL